MASPSVTNTFTNGTSADATQVNTNFTDIINGITDGTKDLSISALTCAGAATLNGNVTLGNGSVDDITITGSIAASVAMKTTFSNDFGSSTVGLKSIYLGSDDSAAKTVRLIASTIGTSYTLTLPPAVASEGQQVISTASGVLSFRYQEKVVSKTTTYTATGDETVILCDTSAAAWTLTLPAAANFTGKHLYVKKTTSDFDALTIDGNASETIDGSTTTTLNTQYESVLIVCDGSNWHILERKIPSTWISVTPTGDWVTNATYSGMERREGDSLHCRFLVATSGAPTATGLTFDIPHSLTIDTGKIPTASGNYTYLGRGALKDGSGVTYAVSALYNSTTDVIIKYEEDSNTTDKVNFVSVDHDSPVTFTSDDYVYIDFIVPISGWKS